MCMSFNVASMAWPSTCVDGVTRLVDPRAATIKDARERFVKEPRNPDSFVPFSYETWGAPGTDLCHHSGGSQSLPNDGTALRIDSQDNYDAVAGRSCTSGGHPVRR